MKISSVGKKVAIGAGAAAAVGLTALAYVKGRKNLLAGDLKDTFEKSNVVKKAGMAIGDGYKAIGTAILNGIKAIPEKIKGIFHKGQVAEGAANKADAAAEGMADTAANAAQQV